MASIALAAGLGAAGSIGGGLIGASGAENAANAQASAAEQAAQLQAQLGQEQLGFENYTYQQGLANQQPWLQSGANSLANLDYLMGVGANPSSGGSAPTPSVPGYNGNPMSQGGVPTPSPSVPMGGGVPMNAPSQQGGVATPSPSVPMAGGTPMNQGAQTLNAAPRMTASVPQSMSSMGTATLSGLPGNGTTPSAASPQNGTSSTNPLGGRQQGLGTAMPMGTNSGTTLSIPGVGGAINLPGVSQLNGTANTTLGAYGSLMGAYPGGNFQAPTLQQAENTPGYQFALQQGENAMQASAAANGSLLTGGTMNALDSYAQGLADTNYNNIYNQALQGYQTNYNTWANQQANEFNRLSALSGTGQTAAQQLNSLGATTAGQVGNTLSNTAGQIGQQMNNAGAAIGSGYVGASNALGGALSGSSSSLSNGLILSSLMNGGQIPGISPNSAMGNALLSSQSGG